MSSLYELVADFKELEKLNFEEKLENEQIEKVKEIIKGEIETKGTNIIALIRNIETDVTHHGIVPSPLKYSFPFISFFEKYNPASNTSPK